MEGFIAIMKIKTFFNLLCSPSSRRSHFAQFDGVLNFCSLDDRKKVPVTKFFKGIVLLCSKNFLFILNAGVLFRNCYDRNKSPSQEQTWCDERKISNLFGLSIA